MGKIYQQEYDFTAYRLLCGFVFEEQLPKGIKNSYIVKFEKSRHALFIEEIEKLNTELEILPRVNLVKLDLYHLNPNYQQ